MERRKRIIHSDDFVDFTVATRVWLESLGYEVRTAHTAEETLALVREWPPDLVITDIMKPGGGLEVIRHLKADATTAGIPVMVLSATLGTPEGLQGAWEAGADAAFAKPIEDYAELARLVARVLGEG